MPPSNLEAEASGLLDRLLNVFYEEQRYGPGCALSQKQPLTYFVCSQPILIDATLNCLMLLIRSRQSIVNKIISTVLSFNPLKNVRASTMGPRERIVLRSLERNTRLFLMNIVRRNGNAPIVPRIQQHVDRMLAMQMEFFDEGSRKRGPPEPTDGLDSAKRARLNSGLRSGGAPPPPPLPPGPVTIAQLYTLTSDEALRAFDVTPIPVDLVVRITMAVLQHLDSIQLDEALNHVRSRYVELSHRAPPPKPAAPTAAPVDAEDDYEPELEPVEDAEHVLNQMDMAPPGEAEDPRAAPPDLAIGTFTLPQPPPVSREDAAKLGTGCVTRVFGMMNRLDEPDKTPKPGLHRLAGSRYDKEAWVMVVARLATRAHPEFASGETDPNSSREVATTKNNIGDSIRETLWKYVVDDFRHRIDVAISWLNEEWYNDKITTKWALESRDQSEGSLQVVGAANYEKWALRLLDAIIPYLDAGDKLLVRFLGEVPEVTESIMSRVKNMANDPDRISLTVKAL